MHITTLRLSLILIALMALASCEHQRPPAQQRAIATPGQHWMQDARLKKVMEQIAGLHGAFPKGLPADAESPEGREARQALAELAAVSNALADAAQNIPAAVENKTMSADDRSGFVAEAARLRDQAITLRDAARNNRIEPLQGMQDNINATCISCHSRYRDIAGALNSHRASVAPLDRDIAASSDARNTISKKAMLWSNR